MKLITMKFAVICVFLSIALIQTSVIIVHAAGDEPTYIVDQEFLPENIEIALEFINSLIAIGIASLAFLLSKYLQGSQMEKGWRMVVLSTILFVFKEIYGALRAIGILHITGMRDFLEFLSMGILLYGFWIIYRTYSRSK